MSTFAEYLKAQDSYDGLDDDNCSIPPVANGFQVRQFRQDKNMTQRQFATAYDIPLSTLKRWESERNAPRLTSKLLAVIAEWSLSLRKRSSSV